MTIITIKEALKNAKTVCDTTNYPHYLWDMVKQRPFITLQSRGGVMIGDRMHFLLKDGSGNLLHLSNVLMDHKYTVVKTTIDVGTAYNELKTRYLVFKE